MSLSIWILAGHSMYFPIRKQLFARLNSYGVRGTVLAWPINFFSCRTHQTKVGTALFDAAVLCRGVVQGSGICPLTHELIYLFIYYVMENRMPNF